MIVGVTVLLVVSGAGMTVALTSSSETETAETATTAPTSKVSGLPGDITFSPPSATTTAPTPAAAVTLPLNPTVIVLDASGSMKEEDAPGPRIDAAKLAALTLVDGLPDGSPVGLIVYGTSTDGSDAAKPAGCQDIKTLVSVAPVDKEAFAAAVNGVVASGYTPLGSSLRAAAAELPAGGLRNIIVVSDGEDTCQPPEPCAVATEISGGELTIHAVGFRVSGPAKDALTCIAHAGGGRYVDAANATQLQAFLRTAVDPNSTVNTLTHNGFGDMKIGMTVDQARSVDPSISAATAGTVVIVWRDCDLTFTDGTLVSIEPHQNSTTQDGLTIGDYAGKAAQLYGSSAVQTDAGRSHAVFAVEPGSDLGYDITFTPSTAGQLAGQITRIVLCRCKPASSTAVTAVNAGDYLKTPGRWWFRTPDDGWNCSITDRSDAFRPVFCESRLYTSNQAATYSPPAGADVMAADCDEIGLAGGMVTTTATKAEYGLCGHGDVSEFYYDVDKGTPGLGRILADGQVLSAGGYRCFVTGFAVTCAPDPGNGVGFTVDQNYHRIYPRDGSIPGPGGTSCPTSDQLIQSFVGTDPTLVPKDAVSFTDIRCADGSGPLQRWLAAVGHFANGSTTPVLFGWDHEEKYWFEQAADAATCQALPSALSDVCDSGSATSTFVGQWHSKFSTVTIDADGTGTLGLTVPCCKSATYPVSVAAEDNSVTVTVVGPPTIVGDYSPDLAIGSTVSFRWATGFEGEIITGRFPGGSIDARLCAQIEDARCEP